MRPRLNVWEVGAAPTSDRTEWHCFNEAQTQRLGSWRLLYDFGRSAIGFNEAQTQRLGSLHLHVGVLLYRFASMRPRLNVWEVFAGSGWHRSSSALQ